MAHCSGVTLTKSETPGFGQINQIDKDVNPENADVNNTSNDDVHIVVYTFKREPFIHLCQPPTCIMFLWRHIEDKRFIHSVLKVES